MYERYVSSFYDGHHVEFYSLGVLKFVKQQLDELERPALITECTSNMGADAYKERTEEEETRKTH